MRCIVLVLVQIYMFFSVCLLRRDRFCRINSPLRVSGQYVVKVPENTPPGFVMLVLCGSVWVGPPAHSCGLQWSTGEQYPVEIPKTFLLSAFLLLQHLPAHPSLNCPLVKVENKGPDQRMACGLKDNCRWKCAGGRPWLRGCLPCLGVFKVV